MFIRTNAYVFVWILMVNYIHHFLFFLSGKR